MNRIIALLLLLIVAGTRQVCGQQNSADSLKAILPTLKDEEARVRALNLLSDYTYEVNVDSAYYYADEAQKLAEKLGYTVGYGRALMYKAVCLEAYAKQDSSALLFNKAIKISLEENDTDLEFHSLNFYASLLNNLGQQDSALACYEIIERKRLMKPKDQPMVFMNMGAVHLEAGRNEVALNYFHKSDSIAELQGNLWIQMFTSINAGMIYYQRGDYVKAIDLVQKGYDISEQFQFKVAMAEALNVLAGIYIKIKDNENAEAYARRALEMFREMGNAWRQSFTLNVLANVQFDQQNYEGGKETVLSCLHLMDSLNISNSAYCNSLRNMGLYYAHQSMSDSSIYFFNKGIELAKSLGDTLELTESTLALGDLTAKLQRYDEAAMLYLQAYEMAEKRQQLSAIGRSADGLYKHYKRIGSTTQALKYHEIARMANDSIMNEEIIQKGTRLQVEFEAKQREDALLAQQEQEALRLEAAVLREKSLRNNSYWILGSAVALVTILAGVALYIRKKRQKLLRQEHEQLRQIDEMKTRHFTQISHELRTPLSLILGPVDDISRSVGLDDASMTRLRIARKSGKDMLRLLNEMLDLAKLKDGKVSVHPVVTHLEDFIRSFMAPFQAMAELKKIELSLDYMPLDEMLISVDQSKLKKILQNLVSNAFKFTPAGGKVTMIVDVDSDHILIKVKDTGHGIDEAELPHVFDPYYQSKRNQSREGGVGIGLALCKELASLLSGEINVNSVIGKGTTFSFNFPVVAAPEGSQPILDLEEEAYSTDVTFQADDRGPAQEGATVLVVEDHPEMRTYLTSILQDKYQVITAQHGKEAMRLLKSDDQKVDFIISDVMMPEMDGFELLETVKKDAGLCTIPMIMLTAKADQPDRLKALLVGVDDYLAKPFSSRELLIRINNLLRNRQQRILEQKSASPKETPVLQSDLNWMKKVEGILERELGNAKYGVGELADELSESRRNIQRRIKKITGLTPNQYIRQLKLAQAKLLIESGDYSTVSEIAYRVGFDTPHHFSTMFTEHFGQKPSEFLYQSA